MKNWTAAGGSPAVDAVRAGAIGAPTFSRLKSPDARKGPKSGAPGRWVCSKPTASRRSGMVTFRPRSEESVRGIFYVLARLSCACLVLTCVGSLSAAEVSPASPNPASLRLAVENLIHSFPDQYTRGAEFLETLVSFEKDLPGWSKAIESGDKAALEKVARFHQLEREALLANPLLDFEQILLVKRRDNNLGLPQNWQGTRAWTRIPRARLRG